MSEEGNVENLITEIEELFGDFEMKSKDLNSKLNELKKISKGLKKEVKKEKKPKVQKEGVIKMRKIAENAILYRGGLNLYQYKQSAIDAGFQNPFQITLKELIKDFDAVPVKEKKSRKKKEEKAPEEGGHCYVVRPKIE